MNIYKCCLLIDFSGLELVPSFVVFEIYPNEEKEALDGTRIGFSVSDIHKMVEKITEAGYEVVTAPKKSKWGKRSVVKDSDGRSIELLEN